MFPQREVWIAAETTGVVIGLMVIDGDLVDQLYVDPGHTGADVGSELLAKAKFLRPQGLQLWTFQSNEGARRFYERHGVLRRRVDRRSRQRGASPRYQIRVEAQLSLETRIVP